MAEQTEADFRTLQAEVSQLRSDLAKLGDTLQSIARHGGAEMAGKLRNSALGVKDEAARAAETLAREIEERPVGTAVAAFAVGVVLGMLVSRRS
jgi:ElaB/YqjD/DUF883 family membrane-anchored ribosome-binding protein